MFVFEPFPTRKEAVLQNIIFGFSSQIRIFVVFCFSTWPLCDCTLFLCIFLSPSPPPRTWSEGISLAFRFLVANSISNIVVLICRLDRFVCASYSAISPLFLLFSVQVRMGEAIYTIDERCPKRAPSNRTIVSGQKLDKTSTIEEMGTKHYSYREFI